jgi:L-ribulose-5-phosphate 3-epimerase
MNGTILSMKRTLSVFTNCFGADGVRAAAEHLRETGFDHLELALRGHNLGDLIIPETAVITPANTPEEVTAFVQLLKEKGIGVSGCNVGGADIRTPEGVEITERRIRFAKQWFGVNVVISGAGQPTDAAERSTILKNLTHLGEVAKSLDITIALETHKGPTQNAAAMLLLMKELAHPNVLLNFDTGNIAYYNNGADPVVELEKVAHLVRNVHLKDSLGGYEDWYFPALGQGGEVDFIQIREILDAVGFTGSYTVEIEGIAGEPEPGLNGRVERIRQSYKHLVSCGYV